MNGPVIFTGDMELKMLSAWAEYVDTERLNMVQWLKVQDALITVNSVTILVLTGAVFLLGYRVYRMESYGQARGLVRGTYSAHPVQHAFSA